MLAGSKFIGGGPASRSAGGTAKGVGDLIGFSLEHARRELLEIGQSLSEVLEPVGIGLANEAQALLKQQRCKIAVVGQIKAGKSNFINALVGKPGLLPTDINPATSAITSLHFNQASPTGDGAIFRFFTPDEWENLAHGSSRLRDLTQRLVPGFEPTLLKQNILAVISRASRRLGPQYQSLLGQSHAFPTAGHEVLLQYVCAGEPGNESRVGLYSDITQSADIYVPGGPFAFPVTLIDTPGTNDPFLIRDEITRNSLDRADAHIVVLSAHQPLADGDVSLLRILRGLHKERIVVFINRIDELSDVERDTAEVVAFVRKRLAYEFPGSEIPIVAGSAKWGCERKAANDADRTSVTKSAMPSSGMAEMSTVLNDLLATTHSAYVIRQIAVCYGEMARASEVSVRQELQALRGRHQRSIVAAERAQSDLARLQVERQSIAETQAIIERSAKDFDIQLRAMLQEDIATQRSRLNSIIDLHAANERDALVSHLLARRGGGVWTCDVTPLRRALSTEFMVGFRRAEGRLGELTGKVVANLKRLIVALQSDSSQNTGPELAPGPMVPPNPTSLGRPLALDLDGSWWSQLFRAKPTPDERGATLESLIKEEFYQLVENLLQTETRTLEAYIATNTRWSFGVCTNIVQALARRLDELTVNLASVRAGVEGTADAEILQGQITAAGKLEHGLKISENALARLSVVCREIGL